MFQRSHCHIGMFDSGIGGLTVLKALKARLPFENVIYFGDTARMPYGDKSRETVSRYSMENVVFLMEQEIKLLVIACNTACSALSLDKLQKVFNIPVIGVIEPGAEKAIEVTKSGRIAVLGTKGTISSLAYQKAIQKRLPMAHVVPIACPLLAPLVEEGLHEHPATRLILGEYLSILKDEPVDTLLLGCTHYPPLKRMVQEIVGEDVQIVDSANTCAEKVAKILEQQGLEGLKGEKVSQKFFVSDNPEKFQNLGKYFIDEELHSVSLKPAFFS